MDELVSCWVCMVIVNDEVKDVYVGETEGMAVDLAAENSDDPEKFWDARQGKVQELEVKTFEAITRYVYWY